ncbi:MAG: 4Fe-4S dicluster domain-containing protein [Sphaerochaeta sp.]
MDCGACTAVCSSGALWMDSEAKLQFDVSHCVVCGLCVHACPMRLFEVSHEREA